MFHVCVCVSVCVYVDTFVATGSNVTCCFWCLSSTQCILIRLNIQRLIAALASIFPSLKWPDLGYEEVSSTRSGGHPNYSTLATEFQRDIAHIFEEHSLEVEAIAQLATDPTPSIRDDMSRSGSDSELELVDATVSELDDSSRNHNNSRSSEVSTSKSSMETNSRPAWTDDF
jgi:hypothetical protein